MQIWDIFEGKHLFNKRLPSRDASAGAHLARMISLLGAPPEEILQAGTATSELFGESGKFIHYALPNHTTLTPVDY